MERPARHFLGQRATVVIDRPLGSRHPRFPDLVYPVNYGYVPDCPAPDGEDQDAYVLGVAEPLAEFIGVCVAVIHRLDDVEDKLVVAPKGVSFMAAEIRAATDFQERYFRSVLLFPSGA